MIQLYRPIQPLPSPFIYAPRSSNTPFNLISQEFGRNDVPFYAQLGLKGHNGIDFIAPSGTEVFAAHDGKITKAYDTTNSSTTIGYGVWITHIEGWQTVYFHLKDVLVKVGDMVKAGDLIGHADNTGKYTTGSHLHFGLYPANPDKGNGYDGAIDPIKYFSIEQITGIITKKKYMKRIGTKNDNRQYAQGEDGVCHWIFGLPNSESAMLKEMVEAGIVNSDIEWQDDITGLVIGSPWACLK
jgi:murein DD-endopeptidase MepM/ murein hydrolase activator NlpD